MSKLTDNDIRLSILKLLNGRLNSYPRSPALNYDDLERDLNASLDEIKDNCYYLEVRKFINSVYSGNQGIIFTITDEWINFLERSKQVKQNQSQQVVSVNAPNYGNIAVTQGNNNVIAFNQQITDAFKQAYDKITDSELPAQEKEAINNQLNDLKQAFHKEDKADVGKIQKISKWLKDNANWITPILANVIKKGIEIACGL